VKPLQDKVRETDLSFVYGDSVKMLERI